MSTLISSEFPRLLRQRLAGLVELTPEQVQSLERHYELLIRWNRSLNLTSIKKVDEIVERHYCESIFLALHLPLGPLSIADIGSGAGFPGFPVAVIVPDCRITLIDAHQRKSVFLREIARGMPNLRVIAKRAEMVEERFDRIISRAVSYEDLAPILKKLARAADLLTGQEAPPESLSFTWNTIQMPWGENRFLRSGVPHETT